MHSCDNIKVFIVEFSSFCSYYCGLKSIKKLFSTLVYIESSWRFKRSPGGAFSYLPPRFPSLVQFTFFHTNSVGHQHVHTLLTMEQVVVADTSDSVCEEKQPQLTEPDNCVQATLLSIETGRCGIPTLASDNCVVLIEESEDSQKMLPVADSDDNCKPDISLKEDGDRNYESEPVLPVKKIEPRKKLRNRAVYGQQGRTVFPRSHVVSKEMRELTRKHALLEKNLKIEGLPEQPPKVRKRRLSLSSHAWRTPDKDIPLYKRKRLTSVDLRPKRDHMPKWELMGGDANDPLNLNGLAHSEEGRLLNLKTPESSPLPTPDFRKIVYIKVPPNIKDPLNLEGKHDQRVIDKMLNSTVKKRHRPKKKRHDDIQQGATDTGISVQLCADNCTEKTVTETSVVQDDPQIIAESTGENAKIKSVDTLSTPLKAAAPVGRRSRSRSLSTSPERKFKRQLSGGRGKAGPNEPQKFPEKPKFTLGNYNRYYGYRNKDHVPDPRLQHFDPSWFKGKDVLDIGCNVGHITLAVAEHFQPHKILGMDIDGKLIQAARQNIRHMLSLRRRDSSKCPGVFEMTRGPLEAHPLMGLSDNFPNNVLFLQGNYVPGSEEILYLQREEFDTILALSITKWIHLNNGDDGLKLFFQKIYRQLRPGGRLILEPQPWSTYRKRAKLSPELFAKYQSIKLKPEGFKHYLLSIGFVKCEVIGVPVTKSKGFRRPLILFTKGDNRQIPNIVIGEDLDVRDVCQECGNTDKSKCDHAQFTGMRRGPYASHMYDHINYPYTSSDSPYISSSRTYSNYSHPFNVSSCDDGILNPSEGDNTHGSSEAVRRSDTSGEFHDGGEGCRKSDETDGSSSSNKSQSSSSSSSSSSSESQNGSGSSRSYSSSHTDGSESAWSSSSSYFSPDPNLVNGDIARDMYSPDILVPNELNPAEHNASNGEIELGIHIPGNAEVNDNIVVQFNSPHDNGSSSERNPGQIVADDVVEAVHHSNCSELIVGDASLDDQDNDAVVVDEVVDENVVVEEDDQLVEPVHSSNSMTGDPAAAVVQLWDNDNQDANMDAFMLGQLPQT